MAITRAKKEEIIKELHEKAEKLKTAVFLNFHNLTASDMTHLRKEFRATGADFKVAKKTLIKRVLNAFGYSGEMPKLDGEAAIVFGYEESPETAKIAKKFMKDRKGLAIIGGIFSGKYVLADFVEKLALLPAREVLLAQAVGLISSPLRGLMNVAEGPMKNLVVIINQLSNKK